MLELLIANSCYVALRLFVTGNIILVLHATISKYIASTRAYYLAVIIMAQLSFWYDYAIFGWYFK
jgi:uncharacterized membrane protein YiaA